LALKSPNLCTKIPFIEGFVVLVFYYLFLCASHISLCNKLGISNQRKPAGIRIRILVNSGWVGGWEKSLAAIIDRLNIQTRAQHPNMGST
jgi:hypothetical protein